MLQRESVFPSTVRSYFCDYLINQRSASPRTIESYRDSFRMFLAFEQHHLGKSPSSLTFSDINSENVLAFLDHLECDRCNSVRSRNARLAAIRSFMQYASLKEPDSLPFAQKILAIPVKRFDKRVVDYLSREEIEAILNAIDTSSWCGQRDITMFTVLYNTGARVSEIIGVNIADLRLDSISTIAFRGKGRKERMVPLWKTTKRLLEAWLDRIDNDEKAPLFPNRHKARMTRSGVRIRLKRAVSKASVNCRSLHRLRISPHVIRHTTAMHLLQSGVDIAVIAMWLGHESPTTTHIYVEANLMMKKRAIEKVTPLKEKKDVFNPSDQLLAFLESL